MGINEIIIFIFCFSLHRLRSRMEEDMDEATGDDRPRHRFGTSEKAYVRKLRVKQKYMGHRNARYIFSLITFLL